MNRKKTAELLTRQEEKTYLQVASALEQYLLELQKADVQDGAEAFEKIRMWFDRDQDQLDQNCDQAGQMLEYAFDFMEAAFGAGQEMVIFITELNCDYYSVKFLQQYECERYYRYNRQLLFEESSRSIEARLRSLGR